MLFQNRAIFPRHKPHEYNLPFLINGLGFLENQYPIHRTQGYPLYQWIYCTDGRGELRLQDQTLAVNPGQGMFLIPNEEHYYYALQEPWSVWWISFEGHQVESLFAWGGLGKSGVFAVSRPSQMEAQFRHAIDISAANREGSGIDSAKNAYALALDIISWIKEAQVGKGLRPGYQKLLPVLEYMETNYARTISLEELSRAADLSSAYVCTLFKQELAMRPIEYLNSLRMQKAREFLHLDPKIRVDDLARKCGFANTSYFRTLFHQSEGVSPGEYRKLSGFKPRKPD